MKSIKEANINNKKVIIRCDLNVPLNNNRIIDDTRIKESIPTIEYCLKYNCKYYQRNNWRLMISSNPNETHYRK